MGGLVVFVVASVLAGTARGFWWLVGARVVQGLGMGTVIPLSQTIIGDITSAHERGRYMVHGERVLHLARRPAGG